MGRPGGDGLSQTEGAQWARETKDSIEERLSQTSRHHAGRGGEEKAGEQATRRTEPGLLKPGCFFEFHSGGKTHMHPMVSSSSALRFPAT